MATAKKKAPRKKGAKKVRAGRLKKVAGGITHIQRQFLDALLELHEVKAAAESCGIHRNQHYRLWVNQPEYAREFEQVMDVVDQARADDVLGEIRNRGLGFTTEIIEEKLAPGGKDGEMVRVGLTRKVEKKYSTGCLIWLGNKYHGNPARLEIGGIGGGPIEAKISVEAFRLAAEEPDP